MIEIVAVQRKLPSFSLYKETHWTARAVPLLLTGVHDVRQ